MGRFKVVPVADEKLSWTIYIILALLFLGQNCCIVEADCCG